MGAIQLGGKFSKCTRCLSHRHTFWDGLVVLAKGVLRGVSDEDDDKQVCRTEVPGLAAADETQNTE